MAFLEAVIRQVVATHPGTSARDVYLVGYSNGGRMAYRLACADPGAFAGVAAVEAVSVSSCRATRPVPLMEVASTGDPLLSVDPGAPPKRIAGRTELTVDALMAAVASSGPMLSGGDPTPPTAGSRPPRGRAAADDARIELAVYRGGSHAWPQADGLTPSARQMIWSFFHGERPAGTGSGFRGGAAYGGGWLGSAGAVGGVGQW